MSISVVCHPPSASACPYTGLGMRKPLIFFYSVASSQVEPCITSQGFHCKPFCRTFVLFFLSVLPILSFLSFYLSLDSCHYCHSYHSVFPVTLATSVMHPVTPVTSVTLITCYFLTPVTAVTSSHLFLVSLLSLYHSCPWWHSSIFSFLSLLSLLTYVSPLRNVSYSFS
jgi:hypothetical protein